ncbi:hypothetical protein, unlikely [Trypanosoma brucei gambiense DAL972]|uniref:Uncharacterized protein n=1 Tax=Trypanosoma brucei gambiense (strain MHOM/CI/86/DAL972) TaxID=679716 RepID=C9ZWP9_TRYB9|nr:hypothetical protein, unlikely [Trypanosoma brucei gambiense DAL972]CBH13838.1 hypothetical protein, unlikely [Trypanosoma brucei gambiense DAL972]|eukprot:XP_011776114.1 hypothetical protein, unlikely [Trypanosoma brucei gambiense DAL972]
MPRLFGQWFLPPPPLPRVYLFIFVLILKVSEEMRSPAAILFIFNVFLNCIIELYCTVLPLVCKQNSKCRRIRAHCHEILRHA